MLAKCCVGGVEIILVIIRYKNFILMDYTQ